MFQTENREWERWNQIRSKGKPIYIFRWVIYWLLFTILIRGTIMITSDKQIDVSDVLAFLSVAVFIGVTTALIRWSVFEHRYKKRKENEMDRRKEKE